MRLLAVLLLGGLGAGLLFRKARLPHAVWPPFAFTVGTVLLALPAKLLSLTPAGQRLLGSLPGVTAAYEPASRATLLLAPLALFAFFAFAAELFRSRPRALLALGVQALFLLETVERGTRSGHAFFLEAGDPLHAGLLVVLPVALFFFVRLQRTPERGSLGGFAVSVAALGLLQPVALLYLAAALAGWALFLLPFRRAPGASAAFAIALLCCLGLAAALWRPPVETAARPARMAARRGAPTASAGSGENPAPAQAHREATRQLRLEVLRADVFSPLLVLAIAGLPLLFPALRRDDSAPYLLGSFTIPPLLVFTPAADILVGAGLSPREVRGLLLLPPVSLVVAHLLSGASALVRDVFPRPAGAASVAWRAFAASSLALAALLLTGPGALEGYAALTAARARERAVAADAGAAQAGARDRAGVRERLGRTRRAAGRTHSSAPRAAPGEAHLQRDREHRARRQLRRALRRERAGAGRPLPIAVAYGNVHDPGEELRHLRRALREASDDARVWVQVARNARKRGDVRSLQESWGEVLRLQPGNVEALLALGWHYAERWERERAREFAERAASAAPDDPRVRELGARLRWMQEFEHGR